MKTLTLLRHAKAVEAVMNCPDHERELRARGLCQAAWVGEGSKQAPPALVLCSTATRTRQTLDGLLAAWGAAPAVIYDRALYFVSAHKLLERLAEVPDEIGSVWLIGHNPGLHDLARRLAGGDRSQPELHERFPTGARAVFELDGSWDAIGDEPCRLVDFIVAPSFK